jgi:hypothetical protein
LAKKALSQRNHGMDSVLTLFIGTSIVPQAAQEASGTHAFFAFNRCCLCWRAPEKPRPSRGQIACPHSV